jgi:hypothetical protein
MKQKTITVYEYMELPEIIKEKIKANHYLIQDSISIQIQNIKKYWESFLTDTIGFIDVDIKSDVSFSQGSGTSFTFSGIDGEKLENYLCYCNNKYEQLFFVFTKCLTSLINVYTRENNFRNYYVHEKTVYIDWNLNNSSIPIKLADNIDWFIENYIEPLRLHICNKIQSDLEDLVLYSYTDEYAKELFKANYVHFTINGEEI